MKKNIQAKLQSFAFLLWALTIIVSCSTPRQITKPECSQGFDDRTFTTLKGYTNAGQKVADPKVILPGTETLAWYHPTQHKHEELGGFGAPHTIATGHEGIDIINKLGSPIYAAADGKVVYTIDSCSNRQVEEYDRFCGNGWGNHIIIEHTVNQLGENIYTRYAHLNTISVKNGALVKGGQLIATMGHSGASETPHLHFELGKLSVKQINACAPPQNFDQVYNPMQLKFKP